MPEPNDPAWEWSAFWRSNQLTSCMPAGGVETAGELASHWDAFFRALPEGAQILDLGTGNGSLAAQAVAISQSRAAGFAVHGVDLANIDPANFVTAAAGLLRAVTFHRRTPLEQLPFANDCFDAIVSQYAIEYTDTDSSLAEALRVLKPGAPFRFLLHSDDGVLKTRCRLQSRQAHAILDSPLFAALMEMLKQLNTAERHNTPNDVDAVHESIAALGTVVGDLEATFAADADRSLPDKLLTAVRSLSGLRKSYSIEVLLAMAENIRVLLVAQVKRLEAMQQAALSEAAANDMVATLLKMQADSVALGRAVTGPAATCVGYWLFGKKAGLAA